MGSERERVIAKSQKVCFVFASMRLLRAFRAAARSDRRLSRSVDAYDILAVLRGSNRRFVERIESAPLLVLSHADEAPSAFTRENLRPMFARAFHLLVTDPRTHPDMVAQWIRTSGIRSAERLHVVNVDDLGSPRDGYRSAEVAQLLFRLALALALDEPAASCRIVDAYLTDVTLHVRGPGYRMLHVPLVGLPEFQGQSLSAYRDFEIDPDGSYIYWPRLDVHMGWNQFLQAVDPDELRRSQQKSDEFNKRYGAAIRAVREAQGLRQSEIDGLTERQLRRIEQGECRATSSALTALAKAHGLATNAYLDNLARTMKASARELSLAP
jgi:hypothetical protein